MTKVRLLVGDTDTTRQQLLDEEIYFVLTAQPIVNFAAADCADLLAAKYAFQINTENSKLAMFAAARHKHYADLAKRMRDNGPGETPGGAGAGLIVGSNYAGGISVDANDTIESNTDNVLPPVAIGQDDYDLSDNPLLGEE
jgi:hypothetical protein